MWRATCTARRLHQSAALPGARADIPSGLHSDTGASWGALCARRTPSPSFGLKPGLLTLDGPDRCGEVTVADLGLPAQKAAAWVASPDPFRNLLKLGR